MNKKNNIYLAVLLIVAMVWGAGFTVTKMAFASFGPLWQTTLRFGLAGIVIAAIFYKRLYETNKKIIKQAFYLATPLFLCYLVSTYGLKMTTASKAAFFCGIAVVFVPIFSFLFFKVKLETKSYISIAASAIGLFLLSYTGDMSSALSINLGDVLCIMASIFFALQIIFTGRFVTDSDPILLTIYQMFFVSALSFVVGLFVEPFPQVIDMQSVYAVMFLGLFCTAFAFLAQTLAQKHLTSAKVALVLSTEPIFASIIAFILLSERLSIYGMCGGALIILAVLVSELNFKKIKTE